MPPLLGLGLLSRTSSSCPKSSPTACSKGEPPKSSAPVWSEYTTVKCVAVGIVACTRATCTFFTRLERASNAVCSSGHSGERQMRSSTSGTVWQESKFQGQAGNSPACCQSLISIFGHHGSVSKASLRSSTSCCSRLGESGITSSVFFRLPEAARPSAGIAPVRASSAASAASTTSSTHQGMSASRKAMRRRRKAGGAGRQGGRAGRRGGRAGVDA
mmetsp:Transcript_68645/g.223354  ORF Transcript_68645/g.223354 Transcript_68645/m.223354 type:complete len:216 (-) Transcript_68645:7-654(-)